MLSVWDWADCCRCALGCSGASPRLVRSWLTRQSVAVRTTSMFSCVGCRSAPGQVFASAGVPVLFTRRLTWWAFRLAESCLTEPCLAQPAARCLRRMWPPRAWKLLFLAQWTAVRARRGCRRPDCLCAVAARAVGAPGVVKTPASAVAAPAVAQRQKTSASAPSMKRRRGTSPASAAPGLHISPGAQVWTTLQTVSQLQRENATEDLTHDLVRAAADRAEAGVARGALDPNLLHIAGAAVDLQAGVHQLKGGSLGH